MSKNENTPSTPDTSAMTLEGAAVEAAAWAMRVMLLSYRKGAARNVLSPDERAGYDALLSAERKLVTENDRTVWLALSTEEYDCLAGAVAGATAVLALKEQPGTAELFALIPGELPTLQAMKDAYAFCGMLAGRYERRDA